MTGDCQCQNSAARRGEAPSSTLTTLQGTSVITVSCVTRATRNDVVCCRQQLTTLRETDDAPTDSAWPAYIHTAVR